MEVLFLFGWDGYDYNEDEYIEKGNLVKKYKDIEVYHYEEV
ncbi:MAG: hypothetical protein RSB82_04180 [Victivallaceae bacterium]